MKGLPRHELEESIQAIFRGADGDGSGALDRSEFIRCLKESGLGFTRRELNLILSELVGLSLGNMHVLQHRTSNKYRFVDASPSFLLFN